MTDLTQPASAAEFAAAGADPATAANLAMQANIMAGRAGTPDQRIELDVGMRNQPPPPKPAAAPPATTPAEATAALQAHTEAQLGAHLAQTFTAPAGPMDYQFPPTAEQLTDEQFASDLNLKTALHSERMPKFVVDSIAKSLDETSRTLARETPAEARTRLDANKARLSALWGTEYEANVRIVDNLLESMGSKSTALRAFIDQAVPMLDPLSLDLLLQTAKHRAGGR